MSDHRFCRHLLSLVMQEVRKTTTPEERKAAWTWKLGGDDVEFHGPHKFYWHGRACCLWHARATGWEHYMQAQEKVAS